MESGSLNLNRFLLDLLNEQSTYVPDQNDPSTTNELIEPMNLSHDYDDDDEEEQLQLPPPPPPPSPITQTSDNRQYCLIIFNNPQWSQKLRKQSEQTRHPTKQDPTRLSAVPVVKEEEKKELSVDAQFIIQLRQLLDNYMEHTKRPFPIKYFLDFSV